jgi:hypothetical protein
MCYVKWRKSKIRTMPCAWFFFFVQKKNNTVKLDGIKTYELDVLINFIACIIKREGTILHLISC